MITLNGDYFFTKKIMKIAYKKNQNTKLQRKFLLHLISYVNQYQEKHKKVIK